MSGPTPVDLTRCVTFIRTGLPDVHCDRPAVFIVNANRPVCRRHLSITVAAASLDGVVVVSRAGS